MLFKLILIVLAVLGMGLVFVTYFPGGMQPISATFFIPGTTYSPTWAHLSMVVLIGMILKGVGK